MTMSEPDAPRKGRFQPGNTFGRGRKKGSQNKFGPNLREQLLAGIAASGEKKAKRAGVNGKVDGTSFFIETLMENTAAASALLSKLIPPPDQPEKVVGSPIVVNVIPIAQGQMFLPGGKVLMPGDEAAKAWEAFHGGDESWAAYLQSAEGMPTVAAFENLRQVVPGEHETLPRPNHAPPLQLVSPSPDDDMVRRKAELDAMPPEELQAALGNMSVNQLTSLAQIVTGEKDKSGS
jgi:hypothetical protein